MARGCPRCGGRRSFYFDRHIGLSGTNNPVIATCSAPARSYSAPTNTCSYPSVPGWFTCAVCLVTVKCQVMTPLEYAVVLASPIGSLITFRAALRFARGESAANREAIKDMARQSTTLAVQVASAIGSSINMALQPPPPAPLTPHEVAAGLADDWEPFDVDDSDPTDTTISTTRPDAAFGEFVVPGQT